MLFWQCFTNVEWWECHEDIRLEECHEEFEEPEWKREESESSSCIVRQYLFTDEYDNRDEDHPDEDIEKETHREWTDTDEFSSKVQPPDEDTDDLLSDRVTMEVKEVVLELVKRSLEPERCELSKHDNREREDKCRREIRIYRTQIGAEPFIRRWEDNEVHHESEKIPEKYHDHESSEKPHISVCCTFITEKSTDIGNESRDDIESECLESRESIWMNSERK